MTSPESVKKTVPLADYGPRIAVVGAGAVGGYFGGMLARAGLPVLFIGRPAFVDAVKQNGLFLDTAQFQERVKVQASSDPAAARDAEIVLFCVKTTDTAETARDLAKIVAPDAVIVTRFARRSLCRRFRSRCWYCKTRRARRSGARPAK